jgi:thioredoxin reductase (NADPH)
LLDCLIIGGGPAGLTAALYLARFQRNVLVIDAGGSRAARIPLSRNLPGFPDGIEGPELLSRMRTQARSYGVEICQGEVRELMRVPAGAFHAEADGTSLAARTVLLATGICNREPKLVGCVVTDDHQSSSIEGMYAAGDVVAAADQISIAMGHAAVSAIAIHNRLREAA